MFDGVADAADKIVRLLESPEECGEVQCGLAVQREKFSEEAFCSSLRDIVGRYMT